jgi:diguanylate cyclase (GGDEF)-like protein/PAS domain S-box-containing protein
MAACPSESSDLGAQEGLSLDRHGAQPRDYAIGIEPVGQPRGSSRRGWANDLTDWREILDTAAADAVVVIDDALRPVWKSESAERIMGYSTLQASEVPPITRVHPDDLAAMSTAIDRVKGEPGISVPVEYRLQKPDGTEWMHLAGWAFGLPEPYEGHIAIRFRLLGTADLDDDQPDLDPFRLIFENLPIGVLVADRAGGIYFRNATAEWWFPGNHEDTGDLQNLVSRVVAPDRARFSEWTDAVVSGDDAETTVAFELEGGKQLLRLFGQALFAAEKFSSAIAVSILDVTEESRAEARLSAVTRHLPDLALVVTDEPRRIFVSESVRDLLGYEPADFLTRSGAELVHPDDHEVAGKVFNSVQANPGTVETFEVRYLHADGSWRWFEINGADLSSDPAIGGLLFYGRDIHERKLAQAQLAFQATHDRLTGVLNRVALLDALDDALTKSDGTRVGVLFCDVDNFKIINDAFGHQQGDDLLITASQTINNVIRDADVVGRIGGDEFLVVARSTSDEESLAALARRIRVAWDQAFAESPFVSSVSIGCALADSSLTSDDLIRNADLAMYDAKRRGKARTALFHDDLLAAAADHIRLTNDVRASLALDRLEIHYRPIFQHVAEGWRLAAVEKVPRVQTR